MGGDDLIGGLGAGRQIVDIFSDAQDERAPALAQRIGFGCGIGQKSQRRLHPCHQSVGLAQLLPVRLRQFACQNPRLDLIWNAATGAGGL